MAMLAAAIGPLWAAAQDRQYSRTYRGVKDSLRRGTEPGDYWKSCAVDEPAGHPTSEDPALRGLICVKWMLLWGEFLASDHEERLEKKEVERERGLRYLTQAFQLLFEDLAQKERPALTQRLNLQSQLDLGIEWYAIFPWDQETSAVLAAALNYYSLLWRTLPRSPRTYDVFEFKRVTGEYLKVLFTVMKDGTTPMSREGVDLAIEFFESAYLFHGEPVPDLPSQAEAPRWIKATLRDERQTVGIGYAVLPGKIGLQPLPVLVHTDLEMLLLILEKAAAAKVITDQEFAERAESSRKKIASLKISEKEGWKEILKERGDRTRVASLQAEQREVYAKQGDALAKMREQEQLCALLREMGDAEKWAVETVRLASFLAEAKQWQSALNALSTVKVVLYETSQIPTLVDALSIEQSARSALGLPGDDTAWKTKVEAVYKDAVSLLEVNDPEHGSLPLKALQMADWLAQPAHVAPLRVGVQIQLANTLKSLHEYARAEQLLQELSPELEKSKRKDKQLGMLSAWLELELAEGNVGHFYSTLNAFESLGRDLYGEDWLETTDGLEIANALYRMGDIHRAETTLANQMELERLNALMEFRSAPPRSQELVRDEDLLLQARIDLDLGRKEKAEELLARLEASASDIRTQGAVILIGLQRENKRVSLGLAEMDTALGKNEQALEKIERILAATDPLQEMDLWVKAKLAEANAQLALGRDASENVRKFEQLAPHFSQYKELGAQQAIEMEVFLGDYYAAKGDAAQSKRWLKQGLALGDELGTLDQKIEIYRKLGEAAMSDGDYAGAVEQLRSSVRLVNSVSTTIPSDLGKVGYRASRNKATALLVTALYTQYQRTWKAEYLEQMFQAVEQGKSRALSEMVFSLGNTKSTELNLADLRGALPKDGVLLEYYIPEGATDAMFRFVVNRSQIALETLSVTAAEITSRVEALKRDALSSPDHYDEAAFRRKAGELGKILLPAAWSSFEASGVHKVFVVPAGVLYLFPFSLLADEHGDFLDENENIDIAYMPNAALILRPAPRFSEVNQAVAFVNPRRDGDHSEFLANNPTLRQEFQQAFEAWSKATVHWEDPLTARDLLREAEKTDNVFVYAHGRFVPEDPTSSYIRLSDEGGVPSMLSAADILSVKIGRGLWVLAACSTGSGLVRSGDEVLGLPRALLQSGASMVVISLWDVDLAWSWRFMTEFYRKLASGVPASRALHAAAIALRKQGRRPFDWAPFILAGQHGFGDQN